MATAPKKRNPAVEVTIKPGYDQNRRFVVAFEGPANRVDPRTGRLDFKDIPGPVEVTFRLQNPDPSPTLWWSFLSRPPFNIFAFADDKSDDLVLIGKGPHHQIHIKKARRGGQTVEITYQNWAGRAQRPDDSRYNIYLTRGTEPNIIYVVDPIIQNGGQLFF